MGRRGRQVCPVRVMTPERDGSELVLRHRFYQETEPHKNVSEGAALARDK